jgi:hypothetical protein
VTPYRERREQGYYNPKGETPQSTTTENLTGLGAPQQAESKKPSAKKKRSS